jgi:hypothetical protein
VAQKNPIRAGFPNSTFRADVLEKAVLDELSATLMTIPELREELRLAVETVVNSRKPPSPEKLEHIQ